MSRNPDLPLNPERSEDQCDGVKTRPVPKSSSAMTTKCHDVADAVCTDVQEECHSVPEVKCVVLPMTVQETIHEEECSNEFDQECRTRYEQPCPDVEKKCIIGTEVKCQVVNERKCATNSSEIDVVKFIIVGSIVILTGIVMFIQSGIVKVILKGIVKIKKVEM